MTENERMVLMFTDSPLYVIESHLCVDYQTERIQYV